MSGELCRLGAGIVSEVPLHKLLFPSPDLLAVFHRLWAGEASIAPTWFGGSRNLGEIPRFPPIARDGGQKVGVSVKKGVG